ncbi:flagellar biosynthesis anti-sigma factor FlgM [Clostridium sp.]|uniref:flagellar biosynthesis anti-sigma factor FlgM n=1 Tax=Clostridium sp. TaxID=1506 RepID=UPI0026388890|nr:flagellar biosynthesis anti-sigma factor FlgM [Clostridium sp.]
MSINGINKLTYINAYNSNNNKTVNKTDETKASDTIEISSLGKSLIGYSINSDINNTKKVAEIKNKVESGTYNVDAKLTAKSIINVMKGDQS